jgi:DNA polymerase V
MRAKKLLDVKKRFHFEAPELSASIPIGVASESDNYQNLDLNNFLAPFPKNTYLVRANGESMIGENIREGDILVVNRKEKPKDGKIVIAALDNELFVKTFRVIDGKIFLYSANEFFHPKEIGPYMNFEIQGVVKHVIKDL